MLMMMPSIWHNSLNAGLIENSTDWLGLAAAATAVDDDDDESDDDALIVVRDSIFDDDDDDDAEELDASTEGSS